MKKKLFLVIILILIVNFLYAQTITIETLASLKSKWFLLDKKDDNIPGMSVEKAYHFIQEKGFKATPIIVAILDVGVDTNHQDLRDKFWNNNKEIANLKDDDGNGFIDDIHGWNFLGNRDGENVIKTSSEEYRRYKKIKIKFQQTQDSSLLQDSLYLVLDHKFLQDTLDIDTTSLNMLYKADSLFSSVIRKDTFTMQEIEDSDSLQILSNPYVKAFLFTFGFSKEKDNQSFLLKMKKKFKRKDIFSMKAYHIFCKIDSNLQKKFHEYKYTPNDLLVFPYFKNSFLLKYYLDIWNYRKNLDTTVRLMNNKEFFADLLMNKYKRNEDKRASIIGDNEDDIQDTLYGNHIFPISQSDHGTHVAGIIGANRNNNLGIKGIANSVRLMILRVVPDGDEYDKDVALAIFYAVNNGAKIINMSFGKSYSPHKKWIDSAIHYAAQHNVLVVHAAGNDYKNLNNANNYPSAYFLTGEKASNYITVGAIGLDRKNHIQVADFSNYGDEVDVYAPGVNIFSCVSNNTYREMSGTSMAAPMVTGVAALLWSYFPHLSALDIKDIIQQSALKVHFSKEKSLSPLLQDIKVVNAYQAIRLASLIEM
ncbi:MAG: S8 family serine peptidase [Chitinophagaceae bacterium]